MIKINNQDSLMKEKTMGNCKPEKEWSKRKETVLVLAIGKVHLKKLAKFSNNLQVKNKIS